MHRFGEKHVQEYDILAIHEPEINQRTDPLTTYALALHNRVHLRLQPTPHKDDDIRPRVCLDVNKRIDPTTWEVRLHDRNLSTLIRGSQLPHTHPGAPGRRALGERTSSIPTSPGTPTSDK